MRVQNVSCANVIAYGQVRCVHLHDFTNLDHQEAREESALNFGLGLGNVIAYGQVRCVHLHDFTNLDHQEAREESALNFGLGLGNGFGFGFPGRALRTQRFCPKWPFLGRPLHDLGLGLGNDLGLVAKIYRNQNGFGGDPGGRAACYNDRVPPVFSFIRDQDFQDFWDSMSASLSTVEFPAKSVRNQWFMVTSLRKGGRCSALCPLYGFRWK